MTRLALTVWWVLAAGTLTLMAQRPTPFPSTRVDICHRVGNGTYRVLTIDDDAVPRHLAHGDGFFYQEVPGVPGFVFGPKCELCPLAHMGGN